MFAVLFSFLGRTMKKLIFLLIPAIFLIVSCSKSKVIVEHRDQAKADESGETMTDEYEEEVEDEEEEDEFEYYDEDLPLEKAVCNPNPCKTMANSNGKCEFDGDNSYVCHCEEGFFWEDYKCIGPCDDNPCDNVPNSDGCYAEDRKTFGCKCKENYYWDGTACLNPCDSKPCPAHSKCYSYDYINYGCGCEDNFFKVDGECVSPCDPNPCKDVTNSTGKCTAQNLTTYICGCKSNYVFTSRNECISPCDPNPCQGKENASGICYTINESNYSCGCSKGFYWSDETEKCMALPECSPENNGLCKDSDSLLIWSSRTEGPECGGYIQVFRQVEQAEAYCSNLKEGGFTDWHLPTIDELRTLIVNCPKLQTGGTCRVSDKKRCLASTCYSESQCLCEGESPSDVFSKFGSERNGTYWSSSEGGFNGYGQYWLIQTEGYANVFSYDLYEYLNGYFYAPVRCVR